jgi:hypothetical protein
VRISIGMPERTCRLASRTHSLRVVVPAMNEGSPAGTGIGFTVGMIPCSAAIDAPRALSRLAGASEEREHDVQKRGDGQAVARNDRPDTLDSP